MESCSCAHDVEAVVRKSSSKARQRRSKPESRGAPLERTHSKDEKMSEQDDPFERILQAYAESVRAKDVDAFVAIYADDVHVFDMWGSWSLQGIAAWRAMAEQWFSSLGDEQVVVSVADARSTVHAEMAVGHASLAYAAVSASGAVLRSLDNRITLAMRKTKGAWKIFHEHTSAPIDHATLHARLKRDGAA